MSQPSFGRAFAVYNVARLGLFAAAAAALIPTGMNGLELLLVALLVSSVLSLLLLRRQRDQVAVALQVRQEVRRQAHQQRRARLDEGPTPDGGAG